MHARSLVAGSSRLGVFQARYFHDHALGQLDERKGSVIASPAPPKTKSFLDIPSKRSLLPSSLRLLLSGGPGYLHEHCDRLHKELGPIYRESLGATELVFISDTKLIQNVIANEGLHPHHNVPEAWSFYNRIHNVERGLFFLSGEPWAKLRKAFNKVMLADPKSITKFTDDLLKINSDLLDSWKKNYQSSNGDILVDKVKLELCKWSIEATCFMLFGNRLGCISGNSPYDSRANNLVMNISNMFSETSRFQLIPVELAYKFNLPTWRRFELATSNMLKIASEYTKENISRTKAMHVGSSLIGDLLKLKSLTDKDISLSVTDLIIAAADTTSNSLEWMLYQLAKLREVQSKIFLEVESILEKESVDFTEFREKTPYLRAFVKEALRLYPTAPFLARTLDKDLMLGGYLVPAGKPIVFSLYTTGRMDRYFNRPNEFYPDRWIRSTPDKDVVPGCPRNTNHAYASLPFGVGPRMCIGRRAADLELCLFVASLVKEFECSLPKEDDEVKVKLKMILCPSRPIRVVLKPRKKSL